MGRSLHKRGSRLAELAGDVPRLATTDDIVSPGAGAGSGHAHARMTTARSHRINLKAVAEACLDEGLDPAVEIARVLRGRPSIDDDGNPHIDPVTGEQVHTYAIEPEVRLRTLNSLLEFTQPKLKAVEVKMSGNLDLSPEQLDARVQALLAKALKE